MKKKTENTPLKWAVHSVKKQFPIIIVLTVLSSVLACTGTVAALVSKYVIDYAKDKNMTMFISLAAVLVAVYLSSVLLSGVNNYLSTRCNYQIEMALKAKMFSMVTRKQYGQISGFHSGTLLNRLTSDASIISNAATSILPNVVSMITKLICAFVVIVCFEPLFALVFIVGGISVFIATRIMRNKLKKLHKDVQKQDDEARSFWHECLTNLLAVKVFSVEDKMNDKSDELQGNTFKALMKKTRFSVVTGTGYSGIMYIGYLFAFIWSCTRLIFDTAFTFGTFTAIMQLVGQVQQPFSTISSVIPQYYSAMASAERILEIEMLDDEKQCDEEFKADDVYSKMDKIRIEKLTFAYSRDKVFDNLDFDINKGDFVAIVGHSGIGKSTLFKIMLGVYSPQNGSVDIICGNEKINCNNNTRKLFSYVPQGNMLFSGSIRENILLVNDKADDNSINNALRISCADEFIHTLPNGLDTVIGEKGLGLSEGQVQRLAIARALIGGAPVLLLDEATSALDAVTEARVLENLRAMESVTCIIVTHRKQALSICDKKLEIFTSKALEK